MSYRVMAPEFETLVDQKEPIQTVAGGFIFTEGPIWHPTGPISPVLGYAGRRPAAMGCRGRRPRGPPAREQMQRHDL